MARIIKNATYGTDVGSSDRLPFTNEKGEVVLAPKRWTESWIQRLSHKDFWAVYHAHSDDAHYWSIRNFRTLARHGTLLYHEMDRRQKVSKESKAAS